MILSQEDKIKLNYFANNEGAEALEYLAQRLFEYYANEAVIAEGSAIAPHQGAARLAAWLKKLPKGLRDAANATATTEY